MAEKESRPRARAANTRPAGRSDLAPIVLRNGRVSNPPNYAIVPLGVFLDYRLDLQQLRLLGLMLCYTDREEGSPTYMHCRPSTRILAQRLGVSRRTLGRLLAELGELGYVIPRPRPEVYPDAPGDPRALCYRMVLPELVQEPDWPDSENERGAQSAYERATVARKAPMDAPPVARSKADRAHRQTNKTDQKNRPERAPDAKSASVPPPLADPPAAVQVKPRTWKSEAEIRASVEAERRERQP